MGGGHAPGLSRVGDQGLQRIRDDPVAPGLASGEGAGISSGVGKGSDERLSC